MPYLSIVLPCYNVQAYLRECLESILSQPFSDLEVIAIDDASPDHSGDILDEVARADDRVRVIHLQENVGLGEGRNIGLEHATGEYVMFVDSDDWLAPRALEAIADRLKETQPDVLFYDYERAYWWGKRRRNIMNHLFREPPPPPVFTLRERPSVMELFMVAWNKAYRREFLQGLGVRFTKGYYEDVPVAYPVLMAAERITLLDRVCYYYRQQRRSGASITKSRNQRHFEVFPQYEAIFAFMDRHGPSVEEFRPLMFVRMLWHEMVIFAHKDRLLRKDRKAFFNRIADHYHRFKPAGFQPPGLRHRLIERRAFRAMLVFLWVKDKRAKLKELVRSSKRRARATKRWLGRRVRAAQYRMYLRRPMQDNVAVFASYWYREPASNPWAIYNELQRLAPGIECVWLIRSQLRDRVPPGVPFEVAGSRRSYELLARAKYLVNNVNYPDFVRKRPGQIHLMTQHGTPLKTMGIGLMQYPTAAKDMDFDMLLYRSDRWDYNLSSNRFSTEVWERVYPCRYRSLELGYPRNDRYYTGDAAEVREVRRRMGIAPGKTAILYAPTHRDYRTDYEPDLDLVHLTRTLPDGHLLMVRAHYLYDNHPELKALEAEGAFLNVSDVVNTEDVCLAADVLITDYSSIMFDYANLGRPIVIYADDYETYRRVRGTYFDLLAEPPGAVATTQDELIEVLTSRSYDGPEAAERLEAFRRRFCEWDDGHAAERVVRAVFLGEPPPPPLPFEQRTPAPAPRAAG